MSRETFKTAKLDALRKYKEQAQRDISCACSKRHYNNAVRRYNLCVKKEQQYQKEFWTAEMEWMYSLFKDTDDVSSVAAM